MSHGGPSLDRSSVVISGATHVLAIGLIWWATLGSRPEATMVSYQIEMVSVSPRESAEVEQESTSEVLIETPDPTPPEPESSVAPQDDQRPPKPQEKDEEPPEPEPGERPEETRDPAPARELAEKTVPELTTEDELDTENTGEDINVRLEGVRRDYPQYYENIIRQINRCFRRPTEGSWETTVSFVILRDGSVADADFLSRSGNMAFDLQAYRAVVDCAGKGRFGPLPDDLPYDRLPVSFDFRPSGEDLVPTGDELPHAREVA